MSFDWLRDVEGSPGPKDISEENTESESNHDNSLYGREPGHISPNSSISSLTSPQDGSSGGDRDNIHLSRMQEARKYGFRTNVSRNPAKGSGYIDQDESGNYDLEVDETDEDGPSNGSRKKPKENLVPMPQSCESCTKFGEECSVLNDPTQYPCTMCCEEEISCILPNPITLEAKAGTAAAKREEKRKQKEKEKKEAQRAKQVAHRKIRPEDRSYIACAPCRREGCACSLKKKSQVGPCYKCTTQGVPCTFEAKVVKKRKEKKKEEKKHLKHKNRNSSISKRQSKPRKLNRSGPTEEIPRGMIKKTIKTCFCHPMTFNNVLDPNEPSNPAKNPCHFHTTTAFALLGLGPKVVNVLAPKKPTPEHPFIYTEYSDGHASSGESATTMCIPCTFSRQRILGCGGHSIRGLAGVGAPCNFDYKDAYSRILADRQAGLSANTAAAVQWCSVCPAPAFFECCASASFDENGNPLGEGNDVGCGLLLCEVCAGELCGPSNVGGLLDEVRKEEAQLEEAKKKIGYSGIADDATISKRTGVAAIISLDRLVARAKDDIFKYEDGARADAGFLTTEGELYLWMEPLDIAEEEEGIEASAADWGIEDYTRNVETEKSEEKMEDPGYQSAESGWEL